MIPTIAKVFVALNSNTRPGEIAAGFAFGLSLVFIPGGNLLWVLIFAMTFFLKIHLGVMLFITLLAQPLALPLDPLFQRLGEAVLLHPLLQDFFTKLYNLPLIPWTHFHNTLVMGSLITALILWVPLYLLGILLVNLYRRHIADWIARSPLVRAVGKLPFVAKLKGAIGIYRAVL